ncbi:MAG: hypothetical protein R2831_07080 [Chitinophagaceae bacterium]
MTTACVRERDQDTSTATDYLLGDMAFNDAISLAEDAYTKATGDNLSNYKTTGYCAKITHVKTSIPHTILVDFDTLNCLCNDARYRRGKVMISYTGNSLFEAGSDIMVTFDNYYIDNNLVKGLVFAKQKGLNVDNQPYMDIQVEGKILKPTSVDTIYWNANRTRTVLQGGTTAQWEDDIYEFVGTTTGRNSLLGYFAANITKPVLKTTLCRYFYQGEVEIQPQGHTMRTILLGEGNCDKETVVQIDNKNFSVSQF